MKTAFYSLLIVLSGCFLPLLSVAQPELPEDTEDVPVETPIDGGLCFLLAAGAAYGLKKYRHKSNEEEPC